MNFSEDQSNPDALSTSLDDLEAPKIIQEPSENGLHQRHLDTENIEQPIAEQLVDEAVVEAVEQVTKMMSRETEQKQATVETPAHVEVSSKGDEITAEISETTEIKAEVSLDSSVSAEEEKKTEVSLDSSASAEEEKKTEVSLDSSASAEEAKNKEPKGTEEEEKSSPPEYMDILGNGCLLKKTLVPGDGRETRPLHGDTVTLSYVCRLTDTKEEVINTEETFVVGDGDVIQALDLAVALTELHEEFELITDPKFAFGPFGLEPNIPSAASLTITAKLLRTDESPQYASMTWSHLLTAANKKRERGNFLFGRNEFALSVNSYNKALEILNSRHPSDAAPPNKSARKSSETEDENQTEDDDLYENWRNEIIDTKIKIYNNMAAAQIRVDAFEPAVNSCDEVLKLSPDNVKAWFRRGKAKAGKGEYNEAVRCLRTALKHEPESRIVQSELKRVMASVKAERESQQRIYRRMFGPVGNDSSADDAAQAGNTTSTWRRYLWYGAGVAAVGVSVALASTAFKYHQQHT